MCDRVPEDGMRSDGETSDRTEEENSTVHEVTEWCDRCLSFHTLCQMVKDMYGRLTAIPNRPLLYDVYQYMWDAKETTMLLDSYISWLEAGGSEVNPTHEPHLPYGGITAEMQALLPRMKKSHSVYCGDHTPKSPIAVTYTVRPYRPEDKEQVYRVCLETGDSGGDATDLFTNYPDLLGDRFVGPYTFLCPDLSFVLEDSEGVCGYVLAARDSETFYSQFTSEWLPQLEGKYPSPPSGCHGDSSEKEMLREVRSPHFYLPPQLYLEHPSHLHIDLLPRAQGKGMGTSMIKTILAILKAKGSTGVHLEMSAHNKRALKFYLRRGFSLLEFEQDPQPPNDVLILGREL
jgi:protein O-GlcNAcase/histone acetyltransferase